MPACWVSLNQNLKGNRRGPSPTNQRTFTLVKRGLFKPLICGHVPPFLTTIHHRKRHLEVAAHLELLIDTDPHAFWFVVLDNASAHTTPQLDPFWQRYQHRLEPVFLPSYSPNLNLIERLWRFMRGQLTRNHFYDSLITLAETVVNWFNKLPFSRFCSLMGLHEPDLIFV